MSGEVKRYDALRDLAKKATPGPWRIEDDEDSAAGAVYIKQDTPDWREPIARLYGWHDQNYLELADPTTILGLLAERDALLAERDAAQKDTERMAFIEEHPNWLRKHKKHWQCVNPFTNYEYPVFKTAREAIDAAMQGDQP